MKLLKEERKLIRLIQVGPVIFSIIVFVALIGFLSWQGANRYKEDVKTISHIYNQEHKKELYNKINLIHQQMGEFELQDEQRYKKASLERVYSAYHTIEFIYNKYKNSKSKEEILSMMAQSLRKVRFFNQMGYMVIVGLDKKVYLNSAFPDLEGTTRNSQQLNKLLDIFTTQDETFFTWKWYKPNSDNKEHIKNGFYKLFKPYGIIIGTGYYEDERLKRHQQEFLSQLSKIEYGNKDEYVFVVDYDGVMLMHPNKEFIGQNTENWKDKNGFAFMKSLVDKAKEEKEAYVHYDGIVRPTTGAVSYKTSYVKTYEPWNWIIGSGFYDESLQTLIESHKREIENRVQKSIKKMALASFFITLAVLLISMFVARILREKFKKFNDSIARELLRNSEQNEKLQETLTEKTALEQVIFNSNLVSITDVNGVILYVNDAFCKITGYKKEELVGQNHRILKSDATTKQEYKKLWHTILQGHIWKGISHNKTKNGKSIFLNTTISPIKNANGQIVKFIATRFDITAKVKADLELRKKENILVQQSKMAAMGEMLGAISHQWRQPLSVISIAATGVKMQKELGVLKDDFLGETMESINDSVQYLSRTIDDFRNFYSPHKIESNFDIQEAFEKTYKLVKVQYENNCIQLVKDIPSIKLLGLQNELLQVLINILNNAKDQLIITKSKDKYVFVDAKQENHELIITICDSAGGINEKEVSKIFDPYFTTKQEHHGTGIGLYMSKEIIEKNMGGTLTAYNQTTPYEGRSYHGACFKITLPIK